jgi:lauroyl/myristoyl acyltransferase
VTFCGRDVYTVSGAVRASFTAGAPVVALTAEQLSSGETVGRLWPAVEPTGFDSPGALLQHLMHVHEPSVRAWPESYAFPADCFGTKPAPLPGAGPATAQ